MRKLLVILILLTACASPNTTAVRKSSDKITGQMVTSFLEHERLVFYVKSNDQIFLCHAYNESNGRLLQRVEGLTKQPNTDIVLYGVKVTNDAEYLNGVDFIVTAIEVYNPIKKQMIFIDLNYGDRIKDAFSLRGSLKSILGTISDKAWSAVK